MKIKWTILRPAVEEMFAFYKLNHRGTWTGEVMSIYQRYYRTIDRESDPDLSALVEDAAEDWDEFAEKAAFEPQSRFDKKSLQVQGIDKSNRWIEGRQELKKEDTIVSIVHTARSAPVVSRFQGYLEDLVPPPFGLARLAEGVYRIDVPTEETQRNRLLIAKDYNSAGTIVSSIVCKAAMLSANDLFWSQDKQRKRGIADQLGGEENYIKELLRNILRHDFQPPWELVEL
jgi:hypothetical protein